MEPSSMDISAAGLRAQRLRMNLVAANLANVDTTSVREESVRSETGDVYVRHTPYRRQRAVFLPGPGGLPLARVVPDPSEFRAEYQPGHPHAVPLAAGGPEAGTVSFPNVQPLVEMVEMMAASRAYEANLTAMEVEKAMHQNALRILG